MKRYFNSRHRLSNCGRRAPLHLLIKLTQSAHKNTETFTERKRKILVKPKRDWFEFSECLIPKFHDGNSFFSDYPLGPRCRVHLSHDLTVDFSRGRCPFVAIRNWRWRFNYRATAFHHWFMCPYSWFLWKGLTWKNTGFFYQAPRGSTSKIPWQLNIILNIF